MAICKDVLSMFHAKAETAAVSLRYFALLEVKAGMSLCYTNSWYRLAHRLKDSTAMAAGMLLKSNLKEKGQHGLTVPAGSASPKLPATPIIAMTSPWAVEGRAGDL